MAWTFQHKLLVVKIGLLEEQRSNLQTVMFATDKVLSLANDWTRNADAGSDATFKDLNCLLEDMILYLGVKYTELPGFAFGTNTTASPLFGQLHALEGLSVGKATKGTTVPFNPPHGEDTMILNGVTTNHNTEHQCITAMKEYEDKSLEELRMEDYSINRKPKLTFAQATTGFLFGGGQGSGLQTSTMGFGSMTGGDLFGSIKPTGFSTTPTGLQPGGTSFGSGAGIDTSSTTNMFGKPAAKLDFGTFGFGKSESSGTSGDGLFGSIKPTGFGTTPTGLQPGGTSFGSGTGIVTSTTTNMFGKPAAKLDFGTFSFGKSESSGTSRGGLFGSIKPTGFGRTTTGLQPGGTSFGSGAGIDTSTTTNMFGKPAAKLDFGTFSFGKSKSSGTSGGGLFGSIKPTGFGRTTTGLQPGGTLFGSGAGIDTSSTTNMFGKPAAKLDFGTFSFGKSKSSGTSGGGLFGSIKPTGFGRTTTGLQPGGTLFGFGAGIDFSTTTKHVW